MLRALIVAPAWIGDTVMAQPLFMRLHEKTPGLQLDALAPRWVAPTLQRMPEIAQVIDNPFAHGELSLGARYTLARQLAKAGYQRAYILPNSLKSALIPWLAGIHVHLCTFQQILSKICCDRLRATSNTAIH